MPESSENSHQPSTKRPQNKVRSAGVFGPEGADPDPRFTLANERTFLAWIRTSLAFLAAGIAIEAFAVELFDSVVLRRVIGAVLLIIGAALGATAAIRWWRIERALRTGRSLPLPGWVPVLSILTGLAGVIVLLVIWL